MTTATTEVAIWSALRARLEAMTDLPFTAWPGETFTPPSTGGKPDAYLIVTDFRVEPVRLFHGTAEPTQLRGIMQIAVMLPLRFRHEVGLQMAGLIAAQFAEDTRMASGGVDVSVTKKPGVVGAPYRDGDCWRLPVNIWWQAFAT